MKVTNEKERWAASNRWERVKTTLVMTGALVTLLLCAGVFVVTLGVLLERC